MKLCNLIRMSMLISTAICAPIPLPPESQEEAQPTKKIKLDTSPKCQVLISDIHLGFSPEVETFPFIELSSVCKTRKGPTPKFALSSYKLVIVKPNPVSIVMLVDMERFPYDGTVPFIVIGSPRVVNVDISLSTPHVQSIFSRFDDKRMLPMVTEGSYAVLLLRDVSKAEAKQLHLYMTAEGNLIPRPLKTDQIKSLQSKVVDMAILGPRDQLADYQFSFFWRGYSEGQTNIFTTGWQLIDDSSHHSSLSVCLPTYDGFNPDAFTLTPQSPGLMNSCDSLTEQIAGEFNENCESSNSPQRKLLHSVSQEQLQGIKEYKFNDEWARTCRKHFPVRENILETDQLREWIHFDASDNLCRFTCVPCKVYFNSGFRQDVKKKPLIVTSGFLASDVYDNNAAIKAHINGPTHSDAMRFFQDLQKAEGEIEIHRILLDAEEREKIVFNATMNAFEAVYTIVKTGSSFQAYELWMKMMKKVGLNIGWLHHTSVGAQLMVKYISGSFRSKLLTHMVENQEPFSIEADSSTSQNSPFLAVFYLTLEKGMPVTHFYALIHMANGEKSREMTQSLIDQIEADDREVPGFIDFFKRKLVSIVSDGAAVMVGVKESFKVHLSNYVGRPISNIVCLAHKLDSSYKSGIKESKQTLSTLDQRSRVDAIKMWQFTYFEDFEKSTNDFYTFYMSYGHKKWMHLLGTAEDLGMQPKRIKYVHQIRWSDSHFQAIETLHHNYYAMVEDLKQLRTLQGYDESAHTKASQLYDRMTDKTFMVVLHEFLNVQESVQIFPGSILNSGREG